MKIEMPPWDESYNVNMDELYSELTLEQMENKPKGPTSVKLDSYMQLFEEKATVPMQDIHTPQGPHRNTGSKRKHKGKKILAKGDPGMGKSTFGRKIAYDWAKGVFTAVSVVFFVTMKLIRPGQTIENIIIDQTPVIEGLGVDEPKLKSILEGLGNKSLIIFDGLDEYDLRRSDDVRKIVAGRRLLYCNIILTSRPHGIEKVGKYFPIQVRVEGFSKQHAEQFISRYMKNSENRLDLLDFHRNNFAFVFADSVCFCPLFLLFMCILLGNDEIGIAEKLIPIGEIYMRLIRFICKKHYSRKGLELQKKEFESNLKRMGKIAWKMLKSGQGCVKQEDVINEMGDDGFDFGLLTRHKDSELPMHETAEKQLTFGHVTLREFLGSLGFLQLLDDGESIDSLLAHDQEGKIIMQSPFFLRFSLWLLSDGCRKDYIEFMNRDRIYNSLVNYVAGIVNVVQLDMRDITKMFHILRVPLTESEENSFILKFIQGVLSRCDKTQELYFSFFSYYPIDSLPQLLQCFPPHGEETDSAEKSFTLLESSTNHIALRKLLDCCDKVGLHADLLLESGIHTDLSDCVHHSVRKLSLFDAYTSTSKVTIEKNIPLCPFLTKLSLENMDLDVSVFTTLSNAVSEGSLPVLCSLSFAGCWTSLTGKLSDLFQSPWPTLAHLDLYDCCTDEDDLKTLTKCLSADSNRVLTVLESLALDLSCVQTTGTKISAFKSLCQKALKNIKTLSLYEVSTHDYRSFVAAIKQGHLPKLIKLCISMKEGYDQTITRSTPCRRKRRYTMGKLNPIDSQSLIDLTLTNFVCSRTHQQTVASSARKSSVRKLDISHARGITGNLSKLFSEGFPSLDTLILSDCGLNAHGSVQSSKSQC